jgi:hypothetical protein
MGKVVCRLRIEAVRITRIWSSGQTVVLLVTTVSSTKYGVCKINCDWRVRYAMTATITLEPPISAGIQTFGSIHQSAYLRTYKAGSNGRFHRGSHAGIVMVG